MATLFCLCFGFDILVIKSQFCVLAYRYVISPWKKTSFRRNKEILANSNLKKKMFALKNIMKIFKKLDLDNENWKFLKDYL